MKVWFVGNGKVVEKVNYSLSGSEYELSFNCLVVMVYEFMEKEELGKCGRVRCNCEFGLCGGVVLSF